MKMTQLQFGYRKPSANRGSLARRLSALAMSLLLVCSLPLAAFADTWYLEDGDITVSATESGQTVSQGETSKNDSTPVITQSNNETATSNTVTITATENATANVTMQEVNIVNSDPSGSPQNHRGEAAVTINVADGAEANVTLKDVNIDVHNTGAPASGRPGKAAVQIIGNGDVTIELDGTNAVQSGAFRAGVEKNTIAPTGSDSGSGNGNLTITDENETTGSLKATGSMDASGIGGGDSGDGSNIIISGSAKVTAQGGHGSAGIGGGHDGDGSNITISGSAEVTANGGRFGSGIGGGSMGTGSDITVSGDAQVKAQGGNGAGVWSAGAAIGDGSRIGSNCQEVEPDTSKLTPNGMIEYYAPGEDMSTAIPYKTVRGTVEPPKPPQSAAEEVQTAPLYRVIGEDGKGVSCETERKDGVLTITVDADFASLTGYLGGLQRLRAQGVDTIVFVTKGAASTFALADLLASMTAGDSYTLTHDGSTVTFTLATGTDISGVLK